jgi:hypothetical protein
MHFESEVLTVTWRRVSMLVSIAIALAVFTLPIGLALAQEVPSELTEWPQCWRFETVLPEPESQPGSLGQASDSENTEDAMRMARMIQMEIEGIMSSLTPLKLFEDGHGISLLARIFWEDTDEGREVGRRTLFWGRIITIADPGSNESSGIAQSYSDIVPSVRVQVAGTRFRCAELEWPPDGPPPQPGEATGVIPYSP